MSLVMPFVKLLCSIVPNVCVFVTAFTDSTVDSIDGFQKIPSHCVPYVHYVMDSSNPSREMAQTEQESSCNPIAESAFAKGIRQFTDQTGEWMSLTHCKHLGDYDPFNVEWSMKCGLIYMEVLESDNDFGDYCFNRKVAEAEYNGGAWIVWELDAVDNTSLDDAQNICGIITLPNKRKRALWACDENYSYVNHITKRQLNYMVLGGKYCE